MSAVGLTSITRKMEIDMGHRVTHHGSKCANVHGHRYVIEVTVAGPVVEAVGADQGMVVDFGGLKDIMAAVLDSYFDHTLCLWALDPLVKLVSPQTLGGAQWSLVHAVSDGSACIWQIFGTDFGRVITVPDVPTAENLARLWFDMLQQAFQVQPYRLSSIRVYETPNCWADYRPAEELTR